MRTNVSLCEMCRHRDWHKETDFAGHLGADRARAVFARMVRRDRRAARDALGDVPCIRGDVIWMSHVLDRFGGDRAWDLRCAEEDEREAEYMRFIEGKGCVDDCDNCKIPDIFDRRFRFMNVGFCPVLDDFVGEGDTPLLHDCRDFTGVSI